MDKSFDIIIIGGSYAGLSAGLTLARSRRKILLLDSGEPCNKMVLHSHNFLTRDGDDPAQLMRIARSQLMKYPTVTWFDGEAVNAKQIENGLEIEVRTGEKFSGKKILFATGLTDVLPGIAGFADCWGRSILHCPYCHGYEVKDQKMAVTANGEHAYHLCVLLKNLTNDLTLFTNGPSSLSSEQKETMKQLGISVYDSPIEKIIHQKHQMEALRLVDGTTHHFSVMFAKVLLHQQCTIPERLGCKFHEHLLQVDDCQRTSVKNVYAAGDNCRLPRTISLAVAAGTQAGFMINWDLSTEQLNG